MEKEPNYWCQIKATAGLIYKNRILKPSINTLGYCRGKPTTGSKYRLDTVNKSCNLVAIRQKYGKFLTG